jgi:GAF domain-containing protein
VVANNGADPVFLRYAIEHPLAPARGSLVGRTALERKTVHMPDCLADPEYVALEYQSVGHYRSMLGVPLLREGVPIGVITLMRTVVLPFTEKQINLLTTFADQAVIAIENVRLFDEVQAKTRDLSEALVYQTGSGNILRVIASSPTDVGPVLKAIVDSACELCEAYDAVVVLKDGDDLRFSAHHGPIPLKFEKLPISRNWVTGRAVVDKVPIHVHDLLSPEGDQFPLTRERLQQEGHRTVLSVPMLREGESIGAIVLRRLEVHPFSEKQIVLLQTFADQAVIAIENVRLFEQVQAKTRDLTEALQQQTATSEVLKVISGSPGELEPVFKSMLENAVSICDAKFGNLFLIDGDRAHWEAGVGTPPKLAQYFTQSRSFRPTPGSHLDRVMRSKKVSHTADDAAEAVVGAAARLGGARSTVCMPMVKDEALIGAIFIYRTEVRPFTDKQIELVKNFAAQAVIAIENTRLLSELRESLQQQTATADVLKVISSSPGELEPVFQAMLENATRICEAKFSNLFLREGNAFRAVAVHGEPAYVESWQREPLIALRDHPGVPLDHLAHTNEVVHIHDLMAEPPYIEGDRRMIALVDTAGARTMLLVPMLRENALIGAIVIYRQEARVYR